MKSEKEKLMSIESEIYLQDFADQKWPKLAIYAYSQNGRLVDKQIVKQTQKVKSKGIAKLNIPAKLENIVVKVGRDVADLAALEPSEICIEHFNLKEHKRLQIPIINTFWKCWLLYPYRVTGTVTKKDLPICIGEVDIYEVDVKRCFWRLDDLVLERLRFGLIDILLDPPHRHLPTELKGSRQAWQGVKSNVVEDAHLNIEQRLNELPREWTFAKQRYTNISDTPKLLKTQLDIMSIVERRNFLNSEAVSGVKVSQLINSNTKQLRELLVNNFQAFRYHLCWWPWMYWTWWNPCSYALKKLGTARLEEDGSFSSTFWLNNCNKDTPDLWFVVRQKINNVDHVIYRRYPIPCNTYWDHPSNDPVYLNVTDPVAIACKPEQASPISEVAIEPLGVYKDKWFQIRNANIDLSINSRTNLPRDCGLYYDDRNNRLSPYGSRLDLTMKFHNDVRARGIKYYRWSYRHENVINWTPINKPINHKYTIEVEDRSGFKIKTEFVGPHSAGEQQNLFLVRESSEIKQWGNSRNDGAFAIWETDEDIPHGKYQLKLEMFDEEGNILKPAVAGFKFVLEKESEDRLDDNLFVESDGSLIMHLHIDNRHLVAKIKSISINSKAIGECQFLEYSEKEEKDKGTIVYRENGISDDKVGVEYVVYHPAIKDGNLRNYDFLHSYEMFMRRGVSGDITIDGIVKTPSPVPDPGRTQDFPVNNLLKVKERPLEYFAKCAFSVNLNAHTCTRDGDRTIGAYQAKDHSSFAIIPKLS